MVLYWPDGSLLPGFKEITERYLAQIQALGYKFIGLLAEAFGLLSHVLARFYNSDNLVQHRCKVRIMFFSPLAACTISFWCIK
jgi:isopenicillin N synthase-like dioxygenase